MTTADELRTLLQNDKMWPMLRDISRQLDWPVMQDGRLMVRKLDEESWKNICTAGLNKTQLMAQGIDGGWVLLGEKTSKYSLKKMRLLIDLIKLFGDSKLVRWTASKSEIEAYGRMTDVDYDNGLQ